jgi:hypothetical integral membrane protein (TIGR02206 family)
MLAQYFALHYQGAPFRLLGAPHIAALLVLLLLNVGLTQLRHRSAQARLWTRRALAVVLWSTELSWHIWNVAVGTWTIRTMLPLNMCSVFIWLSGFMLYFGNRRIYDFAYFLGIGAAVQYLATPDLGTYGFPHFRYFQALISHGLLLTAPVYMTVVEGFRPTWSSLLRVIVWANVYLVAVYSLNLMLGSDYLMLNAKPATPSLLDLLPPWPYYILWMELLGLLTCALLYLPFAIRDRRMSHSSART